MKYFVTGGAGFIGSHIVDSLMKEHEVVVYDNLSSGSKEFIKQHLENKSFQFIQGDLLDKKILNDAIKGSDFVFHLAANPDISSSVNNPSLDFEQGIVATFNVLEAMRINKIKQIVFSSSSAVFGEPSVLPTPEDYAPLFPISTYGASKLAAEGLITSYCHLYGMRSWMFRFANVVGPRLTHGAIYDFIKKLEKDKNSLEVLGDGEQGKSYIHTEDCVNSMLFCVDNSKEKINLFNLGTEERTQVKEIAQTLLDELGLNETKIKYTGGKRGWEGDVPQMLLDTTKLKKLGWQSKYNSKQSVVQAIRENI